MSQKQQSYEGKTFTLYHTFYINRNWTCYFAGSSDKFFFPCHNYFSFVLTDKQTIQPAVNKHYKYKKVQCVNAALQFQIDSEISISLPAAESLHAPHQRPKQNNIIMNIYSNALIM